MLRLNNIKLKLEYCELDLKKQICKVLKLDPSILKMTKLHRRSLDARDKKNIHYVCSVDFEISEDEDEFFRKINNKNLSIIKEQIFQIPKTKKNKSKVVIVGFGPGGMFAALILAKAGMCPIVLERGSNISKRRKVVKNFWGNGVLDTQTNVQFGEGGAGAFSDGKLNTGIKSKYIPFVLESLVKYGAPEDILINSKPHIGTDKLVAVVENLRKEIISLGGEIRFENKLVSVKTKNDRIYSIQVEKENKEKYELAVDNLILSIGHSARDTFEMLYERGIAMQAKAFSIGLRIEHPQELINFTNYGASYSSLPPAEYKLSAHLKNGRGVYTFCMCPGGTVVASASEEEQVVTNGMSNFKRDNKNANSALLVNVTPDDFDSNKALAGIEYQRKWERKAFEIAGKNYYAPVQKLSDFLEDKNSSTLGEVIPSYKPGISIVALRNCLPGFVSESIKEGIIAFSHKLKGFDMPDAVLTGVESRSSSPVRILRGENGVSINTQGLYPCAEGAGYAGGIMSSAVDGINTALNLIENLKNF